MAMWRKSHFALLLLIAVAIVCAAPSATRAQGALSLRWTAHTYITFTKDSTLRWGLDTLNFRTWIQARIDSTVAADSMLAATSPLQITSAGRYKVFSIHPDTLMKWTSSSAQRRTYLRMNPNGNLYGLDSTTGSDGEAILYTIENAVSTMAFHATLNFSNTGSSDSNQFVFSGAQGLILPTGPGYRIMFERFSYKTNLSGSPAEVSVWPAHRTGNSADSCVYSVVLRTMGSGGSRTYHLSVYKFDASNLGALFSPPTSVAAAYGTHVCTMQIDGPLTRFPAHGTSVQVRLTIWIRRM